MLACVLESARLSVIPLGASPSDGLFCMRCQSPTYMEKSFWEQDSLMFCRAAEDIPSRIMNGYK